MSAEAITAILAAIDEALVEAEEWAWTDFQKSRAQIERAQIQMGHLRSALAPQLAAAAEQKRIDQETEADPEKMRLLLSEEEFESYQRERTIVRDREGEVDQDDLV